MYILKIIPITKGLPEDSYSYFHNQKITPGSLVEMKIRNRLLTGIVEEFIEVQKEKINIKTGKFALRKIEKVIQENFIDEEIFNNLKDTAILLGVKVSEILDNYLPNYIYNDLDLLRANNSKKGNKIKSKTSYLLESLPTRISIYQDLVKKELAKHNSLLIFLPTINDLEYFAKSFAKNIDNDQLLIFHSQLSKKELKNNLTKLKSKNTFLILSTPNLLPIILKDKLNLQTIILEKESSQNYLNNLLKRPIDFREIIKNISDNLSDLNLIISSSIFSIQTSLDFFSKKNKINKNQKNNSSKLKIINMAKKDLINLEIKNKVKIINEQKNNSYNPIFFAEEVIKELKIIKKQNSKAFLLVKRKGLYPETICKDCQTILTCEKCHKPYLLLKDKNNQKYYQCQNCKDILKLKKEINLTCRNCGGWRLMTLGIATEAVSEDLIQNNFQTFILDANHQPNKKEILKTLNAWKAEKRPSILIGTELALNFLNTNYQYDLASIISLDSLFSIPEINIDQKIFGLILEMLEKKNTKSKLLIQTRLIDQPIWNYIKDLKIIDFLKDELNTRQTLNLPPFTKIITWELNPKNIKMKTNIENILAKIFKEEKVVNIIPKYKIDKNKNISIGEIILNNNFWQVRKNDKISPTNLAKKLYSLLIDFNLKIN